MDDIRELLEQDRVEEEREAVESQNRQRIAILEESGLEHLDPERPSLLELILDGDQELKKLIAFTDLKEAVEE